LSPNLPIITQKDDDNSTIATGISYDSKEDSITKKINNHLASDPDDFDTLDLHAIIGYCTTSNGILDLKLG